MKTLSLRPLLSFTLIALALALVFVFAPLSNVRADDDGPKASSPENVTPVDPDGPEPWDPDTCERRCSNGSLANDRCPDHNGVFVTSNGNYYCIVCCPLPADDILVGSPVLRSEKCEDSEIIVGAYSSSKHDAQVQCQGINTAKYKLGFKMTSCTWNYSGMAVGGIGPIACGGNPPVGTPQTPTLEMGTDGCMGMPYFGALMVERSDKNCGLQYSKQLLYKDGTPVDMCEDSWCQFAP